MVLLEISQQSSRTGLIENPSRRKPRLAAGRELPTVVRAPFGWAGITMESFCRVLQLNTMHSLQWTGIPHQRNLANHNIVVIVLRALKSTSRHEAVNGESSDVAGKRGCGVRNNNSAMSQSQFKFKRMVLIVLDGAGIGAMPDAPDWGDAGSDTLGHICESRTVQLPNLERWGLGNVRPLNGVSPVAEPRGSFGKCALRSNGKDTTTGHWEMAGIILEQAFLPIRMVSRRRSWIASSARGKFPEYWVTLPPPAPRSSRTWAPNTSEPASRLFTLQRSRFFRLRLTKRPFRSTVSTSFAKSRAAYWTANTKSGA